MIYFKKSKNIFVSLLFSGSVNSNLYCKCCPCNKDNSTSGDGSEEKDKDKKDKKEEQNNKNVINNLEGVVGLTCKLENNKICLYTKVPNNDNYKFEESVEDFKGEFKYENFKELKVNIKIDEFVIYWEDCCTIEEQIGFFKNNLNDVKSFEFLSNKIIFFIGGNNLKTDYVYDLSDMRILVNMTAKGDQILYLQNIDFSNLENKKINLYGITYKGKYFKQTGKNQIDDSEEKQEEYKKCFLEGK